MCHQLCREPRSLCRPLSLGRLYQTYDGRLYSHGLSLGPLVLVSPTPFAVPAVTPSPSLLHTRIYSIPIQFFENFLTKNFRLFRSSQSHCSILLVCPVYFLSHSAQKMHKHGRLKPLNMRVHCLNSLSFTLWVEDSSTQHFL